MPDAPELGDLEDPEKYSGAGVVIISFGVGSERCKPWLVRTICAAEGGNSPKGDLAFCTVA